MRNAKVQHPLLGSVDPVEGPDILAEVGRAVEPQFPVPDGSGEPPEVTIAAPYVPEAPSTRRVVARVLAAGLRRLAALADKVSGDG